MNDFLDEAKERIKEAEKAVIFRAIVFIIAGLVMVLFPLKVAEFVCYGVAFIIALFGARFIINYISKDLIKDFFRYDLVFGITLLIFAVYILARSEKIIAFVPTIIGLIVVLNGVLKLQNAIDFLRSKSKGIMGDAGTKLLVVALINIAIGIFLIWDPFTSTKIVYILLGIGVLYSGISDIIVALSFRHTVKATARVFEKAIRDKAPIEGRGEFVDDDK